MAIRIDWKRSLLLTAILLVVLYGLQYVIKDRNVYYMIAIGIFVVFMVVGNLLFRRR